MNEQKKTNENQIIKISREDLDRLLGRCDGNAALLYLHILRTGGFSSVIQAARELKCTETELLAAAGTLRALGLLDDTARSAEAERDELPEYTAGDVAARAGTDPAFEAAVAEAEAALGRVLSSNDLKLLFGIYDYWGLQADVIMELLHHCVEKYQSAHGAGRTPTMRYVEKEAQFWARGEITTLDAVEEYLRREKEKQALAAQVKELLQIHGRELTPGEAKYVDGWLALGFGPEALAIAYDRTVLSTGKLTWKYMDRIVRSWDEKRLYTPEAIEQGDARRVSVSVPANAQPQRGDNEKQREATRRMIAHLRGGKKE